LRLEVAHHPLEILIYLLCYTQTSLGWCAHRPLTTLANSTETGRESVNECKRPTTSSPLAFEPMRAEVDRDVVSVGRRKGMREASGGVAERARPNGKRC
jgi:hypothetical protein